MGVYSEPYDMTGGYGEGEAMNSLLKNPTKSNAYEILVDQIHYWFQVGPDMGNSDDHSAGENIDFDDPIVTEIANRYNIEVLS